jgi:hypothetical protein
MRGMPETQFDTTDDPLVAHSSPRKANLVGPVCSVLLLGALAITVMWYVARSPIRVTRPILTIEGSRVILTSRVSNRMNRPVHLSLSFILGYVAQGTNTASPTFRGIAHHEVEVEVDSRAARVVRCEFALDDPRPNLEAEVQILRRN